MIFLFNFILRLDLQCFHLESGQYTLQAGRYTKYSLFPMEKALLQKN